MGYKSTVRGPQQRRMFVYLPENYYADDTRYPVLYLLHGARGNELSWMEKGQLLDRIDSLKAIGAMEECIVVLPNVNQYDNEEDYGNGRCKNAFQSLFKVDGSTESAFMRDVVAFVDSVYRTRPEKGSRALAGLSIGGMQSIHISATWPDAFDYVGAFSPMIHSYIMPSPYSKFYNFLGRKLKGQFADPPRLYAVMTGDKDFFILPVKCYDKRLTRKGYPHELTINPGAHEWYNWTDFCEKFLQRLWK
ncbi:MAG: hypothetical protein IJS62_08675 [Bacteroidales bacterium]|nr:hypothetical protein [Bacteroidales bacterium]